MKNALSGEKSPYLLQHKSNPVDWHPWGEAAFEKARRENKPVFLSIGYSTCHWCHVMAHESFENPSIAALMNRGFVNVKVDREERPDVDRVYMAFVQAATGGGGWPMSVWLTPEGHPFFGGTYFPPDERYGRMGFPQILQQIENLWRADRGRIESEAGRVLAELREESASRSSGDSLDMKWLEGGRSAFASAFDARNGGFGGAPKFPRPSALNFLMRGDEESRQMALTTLRAMSSGGMCDQLGGGFHRYSVDEFWHVPHFEKMLYDQAQIAVSLVEAWQITKDPFFETTARSTLDYVLRDMTHPSGGFYSAEDADSLLAPGSDEHAEGAFYVWTRREIEALLSAEDARAFCEYHGVKEDGNAPEGSDPHGEFTGKNILIEIREGGEPGSLAASREILLARRNLRPRPHLDDKILTAWNGLMISAFARAGRAFGEQRYVAAAARAADFVMEQLCRDGDLLRSWRDGASNIPGFAEDYAFFIQGLIDLYEADFQIRFLEMAIELQQRQDALFRDGDGYFSSRAGDPLVPLRMKDDYDGAEPSANSVSALNLLRLSRLIGEPSYEESARKILESHSIQMDRIPSAVPQMLVALDFALSPPSQSVVAGSRNDAEPLLAELSQKFRPHTAVILLDSPEAVEFFGRNNPAIREMKPSKSGSRLYLCENFVCQAPVAF
ncbi:MAG: thioredoxin domain-containing protein [Verrucomicrobiaceae bacterium]|nr:MAG: thioredoxin domain-containing protein [Verrucomicrobiaceae bacterium]